MADKEVNTVDYWCLTETIGARDMNFPKYFSIVSSF